MSGGSRFNPTSPARGAAAPAPPAKEAAAEAARERLVDAVLNGISWREVTVPRTAVKGRMRLLTRAEWKAVEIETRRVLAEQYGVKADVPGVLEGFREWRAERMLRVLASAMRDPAQPSQPLADLDEWETCDDSQLDALWVAYQDLEAELDPLGPNAPPLTAKEVDAMIQAAGKGQVDQLMSFGSHKLALFATSSTAARST